MCIKTLNEFVEWAAQFKNGQYLFRGVSKENYKIEASVCRRLPKADKYNPNKLLKINQELIEKARGLGHDQKNGKQLSDLELLAELQHFGAATCLIDFSRNAFVALWFACQKSSDGEANGKVFAVNRDDTVRLRTVTSKLIKKDIDHFLTPDENDKYLLYQWQPKLQNNRIIAQQSIFLLSGAQIEEDAKCVIDKDSKQDILRSLEQISGITEGSIYPDFDGFARLHAHNKKRIEPDARFYLRRGIEASQNNDLDDAIEYYTEVIRLNPADTDLGTTYTYRGSAYAEKKKYDKAIEDYNKAIELNPNNAMIYFNRGTVYSDKGEYNKALEDYNKAIELNPNLDEVYNNRGTVYSNKGEYHKALEDYNKAVELNPNNADPYNNRGGIYVKNAEYNRGLADYNEAIRLNPGSAETYYNRGVLWLILQEWEKAKEDLRIAREQQENIVSTEFRKDYENISNFEQKHNVKLPEDIAALLTPPQAE